MSALSSVQYIIYNPNVPFLEQIVFDEKDLPKRPFMDMKSKEIYKPLPMVLIQIANALYAIKMKVITYVKQGTRDIEEKLVISLTDLNSNIDAYTDITQDQIDEKVKAIFEIHKTNG